MEKPRQFTAVEAEIDSPERHEQMKDNTTDREIKAAQDREAALVIGIRSAIISAAGYGDSEGRMVLALLGLCGTEENPDERIVTISHLQLAKFTLPNRYSDQTSAETAQKWVTRTIDKCEQRGKESGYVLFRPTMGGRDKDGVNYPTVYILTKLVKAAAVATERARANKAVYRRATRGKILKTEARGVLSMLETQQSIRKQRRPLTKEQHFNRQEKIGVHCLADNYEYIRDHNGDEAARKYLDSVKAKLLYIVDNRMTVKEFEAQQRRGITFSNEIS